MNKIKNNIYNIYVKITIGVYINMNNLYNWQQNN